MRRAVIGVFIGLGLLALTALWFVRYLGTPLDIGGDSYRLDVQGGSSMTKVAQELADEGLLQYPRLFGLYGRMSGQAERIQAGEYVFQRGTTPRQLLEQMVSGRVKLHSLTVVEGWTVPELLDALRQHTAIRSTFEGRSPAKLAVALELPVAHAEGQFFPDTYHFPKGTTDIEFLQQAHVLMQTQLETLWAQRAPAIPLTDSYQALILASIVERETALDAERPQVAGVFERRLKKGMRLQTDPTVIYGLGERFDGNLTRQDLQTDTLYNTYTRDGLPPTPISLPGRSSLAAVMNPAKGTALYFVATGLDDGSHLFTGTLEEHNAAVAQYLARLRERQD
jgi:UPF0755 protein